MFQEGTRCCCSTLTQVVRQPVLQSKFAEHHNQRNDWMSQEGMRCDCSTLRWSASRFCNKNRNVFTDKSREKFSFEWR